MIPGEILPAEGTIALNDGRATITLMIANTGDRPIQVGSHYHFAETNAALDFDRTPRAACAGHPRRHRRAVRAGPVASGHVGGLCGRPHRARLSRPDRGCAVTNLSRADYAALYGPTKGDRIRLADTEIIIEVERDLTIPGEEVKFGGGKVVRDGMGQSQITRAGGAMDTVITGVVVFDHQGIVKADVGIRDGMIAGIGKAGNPDTQPGVTLIIGPGTEIIAGEGRILTPAASTATSTTSARSRWTTRCIPASRRFWVAAPAPRMARWPRPARRARGTSPACWRPAPTCR